MVKRIFVVLLSICMTCSLWGQGVDNVTLVVSGDGPTKDVATTVALRSAIEQAFGVFVSANTTILNDELVKDEIATVSSGNVQSYEEISCVQSANGNTFITLKATVSVKNLVTYAQSKGSECEFAGALFGQQMKLIAINNMNAEAAIDNMYKQLKVIASNMFDYELKDLVPNAQGEVNFTIVFKTNESSHLFAETIKNTLESISVKNEEELKSMGIPVYRGRLNFQCPPQELVRLTNPAHNDIRYGCKLSKSSYDRGNMICLPMEIDAIIGEIWNIYKAYAMKGYAIYDNFGETYACVPTERYGSPHRHPSTYRKTFESPWGADDLHFFLDNNESKIFNISNWTSDETYILFLDHPREGEVAMYSKNKMTIPLDSLFKISGFQIRSKGL